MTPLHADHAVYYVGRRGVIAARYDEAFREQYPRLAPVVRCSGPLAVSERLAREVLSLPLYPGLHDAEVDAVVRAVETWAKLR